MNAMDNFSTCLFVMILLKLKEWIIKIKYRIQVKSEVSINLGSSD